MTKKQLSALGLAALLALSLTACGGNTDQTDTADSNTTPDTSAADNANNTDNSADAAQTDAEDISLTTFRDTLKSGDYLCGIAYLGSTVNGATLDSLLDDGGYWEKYPFLKDFPQSQTVTYEGNEAYCIVPRDHGAKVTVQTWTIDENSQDGKAGETLYEGEGVPVILTCNVSDVLPNLLVTVTSNGETWSYNPCLSLCDGTVALSDSPKIYDFSLYQTEEPNADVAFLGAWEGDSTTLSFSADGSMTYTDDVTHRGSFYVIQSSSRYPAGSVQFQWDQEGDEAFWGVFSLTKDGSKLTVTNITGNSLKEDTFYKIN